MDRNQKIEELVKDCTVKVTIPTQGIIGTGFFVAPGLVLTCFHVIKGSHNHTIDVFWKRDEKLFAAEVKKLPENTNKFDIVLLKVSEPFPHPCVYLDDSDDFCKAGDDLYSFGYLKDFKEDAAPVLCKCEGMTGNQLIKFQGGQVQPGLSGAALLNFRTGKVCGMVNQTRDQRIDLGGTAIPVGVIFSQFPELKNVSPETHKEWVDILTPPVQEVQELDENDIETLADLLRRTGKADGLVSRKNLCRQIRVDAGDFDFINEPVNSFIYLLIDRLHTTGNYDALLLICKQIKKIVRNNLLLQVEAIEHKIEIIKTN